MSNELNEKGNGKKVSYHIVGVVVVSITTTIVIMLWLFSALNAKADVDALCKIDAKVVKVEDNITVMRIMLERIATKLEVK